MKKLMYAIVLMMLLPLITLTVHGDDPIILNNGALRFGTGSEASVNATGNLQQPFYYNQTSLWRKLTYNNYPLDFQIGEGGDGTNTWNINGNIRTNPNLSELSITPSAGFNGSGTLTVSGTLTLGADGYVRVTHVYELPAGKSYLKVTTSFENISTRDMSNFRYWVGTRDDYVGGTDTPLKEKGNLINGGFQILSTADSPSKALRISTPDEGILFYTDTEKGDIVVDRCCSFSNVTNKDPRSSATSVTNDGSYAFYVRLDDIAIGETDSFVWYYAAGELADLEAIISDVASAAGAVGNVDFDSIEFKANSSVNGTGYYIVLPADAPAPTTDQIKDPTTYSSATVVRSGNTLIEANVEKTITIDDLNPGTSYRIYFVVEEAPGEFSAVSNTEFTSLSYGPPTVSSTSVASNIQLNQVDTGGTVLDDGSDGTAEVTERGVCWSTTQNPDLSSNCKAVGSGLGSFSTSITGLSPSTTYYVRAYATNTHGTNFASQISFRTLDKPVTLRGINSVPVPVLGETSVTSFETAQYTAVVTWSPNHSPFQAETEYTATITLTAKSGFTLSDVPANFFSVSGAQNSANTINTAVITATYESTSLNQVRFVSERSTYTPVQTVSAGGLVSEPEMPERTGHSFLGWFKEPNFTTQWDFNSDVMPEAPLVLYAKWQNRTVISPDLTAFADNLMAAVDISEELANNDDVYVILRIEQQPSNNVSNEEIDLVNNFIASLSRRPDLYFMDISLLKVVNDVESNVNEANEDITIEIVLPENLRFKENYRILRIHNGVVEELSIVYDASTHTIRFTTNKFSTYTLAYNEPIQSSPASSEQPLPLTDGLQNYSLWFALIGLGLTLIERRLRLKNRTR